MNVDKRSGDPAGRLSKQQKDILIWLYKQNIWGGMNQNDPHNKYLMEPGRHYIVSWEASVFVDSQDKTRSAALSASLKKLEDRGLIIRKDQNGQRIADRRRTHWLLFTRTGAAVGQMLYLSTLSVSPESAFRRDKIQRLEDRLNFLKGANDAFLNSTLSDWSEENRKDFISSAIGSAIEYMEHEKEILLEAEGST